MKSSEANKELLILLKRGSLMAFNMIYERYCNRLYVFVLKYIKQKQEAEGIVQEVFIKIWKSKNNIDLNASFDSYIFTVTYNTTISVLRKKINEQKFLDQLRSIQQISNVDEIINEIEYSELNGKVHFLINQLTSRQKEIFLLSREEGLTHNEIADRLQISANTVKNHMVSVLAHLRRHLINALIISFLIFELWR